MKSMRILRHNPSSTHISTTKFNKPTVNKKIKGILTTKAGRFKAYSWRTCARMGKMRRFYYHDHRYDDPWNFTEDSRIRFSEISVITSKYLKNTDLELYMENIRSKQLNKTVKWNPYATKTPKAIDEKYIESKIMHQPRYKLKQRRIACHGISVLNFPFYFLQNL